MNMQVITTTNSHDTIRSPGKEDLTIMPLALIPLLPVIPPGDEWSTEVYQNRKFEKVVLSTVQRYTYMADNIGVRTFMGYDENDSSSVAGQPITTSLVAQQPIACIRTSLHVEDFNYEFETDESDESDDCDANRRYFKPDQSFLDRIQWDKFEVDMETSCPHEVLRLGSLGSRAHTPLQTSVNLKGPHIKIQFMQRHYAGGGDTWTGYADHIQFKIGPKIVKVNTKLESWIKNLVATGLEVNKNGELMIKMGFKPLTNLLAPFDEEEEQKVQDVVLGGMYNRVHSI